MGKFLLYSIICLFASSNLSAQRVQKAIAKYTYYAPENITLEEAKRTALDRAKFTAIADAFGALVTQSNFSVIKNQNGQTDDFFLQLGGSEVKGEWIETTKTPEYDIKYENNMLVVSVEVWGRIREIIGASTDLTAKILRNGTSEKFESNQFRNGDEMYLYFRSPIDGYLVVYMLDETTQEVFCLLPYRASGDGAYPIEHDKPYILFSVKNELDNPGIVDEYTMTCNRDVEINDIYIIFSPHTFSKANSTDNSDEVLPRQLSYENFQKWLVKLRKNDPELVVNNKQIKIKK